VFLGYATNTKGYRCYEPISKRYYTTMDATFLESEYYYSSSPITSHLHGETVSEDMKWWDCQDCQVTKDVSHETLVNDMFINGTNDTVENIGHDTLVEESNGYGEVATEHNNGVIVNVDNSNDAENDESPPLSCTRINDTLEDVHEVSTPEPLYNDDSHITTNYQLPYKHNRGKPPDRYSPETAGKGSRYPIANYVSTKELSEPLKSFAHKLSSNHIPTGVHEALSDPNWSRAIQEEMEALLKNNTWNLVSLPKGKKTVGCKWVFSLKYKVDGSIERYKARLVAKGYTQTYGVDYQETFSPVAKLNTVRVLLSIAANLDWPLHQFDVKNAFLHGDLEEEVYMNVPPGYTVSSGDQTVCRLQRALYGLKQSPRAWFGRFSLAMKKYGFQQSNSDHTLFLKHNKGRVTALIIYVDDMIITGNDTEEISKIQRQLGTEFEMKNLGGLKYFLGIEVARSNEGIFISQRKYVLDLLSEVGMLDCKPVDTPTIQNHKFGENNDSVPTNKEQYQRLVGKLIYLSHTRPDIAYAVNVVSQYMQNPSEAHMDAVIRIIRYLKYAPSRGLMFYKNNHLNVEGYTDADWAGSVSDRRSTSGYFTFVGGNLVTWRSKKQKVVALSSAEAEFRGMSKGLCELLWLKRLLTEIGFEPKTEMKLFCDNKAAIEISHNPVQHDRTKHIEVDRHFIKQNLEEKIIKFPFVRSEDQLADMLTKAVSSKVFHSSLDKLGIRNIYLPT
jgi:hypothetical protein